MILGWHYALLICEVTIGLVMPHALANHDDAVVWAILGITLRRVALPTQLAWSTVLDPQMECGHIEQSSLAEKTVYHSSVQYCACSIQLAHDIKFKIIHVEPRFPARPIMRDDAERQMAFVGYPINLRTIKV